MASLRSQEELVSWRTRYTYSIPRVRVGVGCVGEVTPAAALRPSAPKLNLAGKPEAFWAGNLLVHAGKSGLSLDKTLKLVDLWSLIYHDLLTTFSSCIVAHKDPQICQVAIGSPARTRSNRYWQIEGLHLTINSVTSSISRIPYCYHEALLLGCRPCSPFPGLYVVEI
jgi:hypothetical protein